MYIHTYTKYKVMMLYLYQNFQYLKSAAISIYIYIDIKY